MRKDKELESLNFDAIEDMHVAAAVYAIWSEMRLGETPENALLEVSSKFGSEVTRLAASHLQNEIGIFFGSHEGRHK